MESITDKPPLVVIVGQTASGKSALAMQLAQQFGGEIIAADSRTVYRGLDIGSAKPSIQDRRLVRHHLLDIVDPDERFTVADFQKLTYRAIADIHARGHIPFVVGGSGLYVDAVVYNFSLRPVAADRALREQLATYTVGQLQALLMQRNISLPENRHNSRHLIRMLETGGLTPVRHPLPPDVLLVGIDVDTLVLQERINMRVDQMLADGLLEEIQQLSGRYGWEVPALQSAGYKAARRYLVGELTFEDFRRQFATAHMQYAKRQKTWFKRDKNISWISKSAELVELITTLLNK